MFFAADDAIMTSHLSG